MAEVYTPSEYAVGMLDEFKKDYQKMKERCVLFEQEHEGFCRRLGLNQDDFDTEKHPDHPEPKAFQLAKLSDRNQHMLSGYLADREKMYILEQCVRNIPEEDVRSMAEAYYLERKTQPEIAAKMGRTKSYVSKKLDRVEKGTMAETVDRYLAWKYGVPGGKSCFWAGEWEKRYMQHQDALHGIIHLPDLSKAPWVKQLRRMGFIR